MSKKNKDMTATDKLIKDIMLLKINLYDFRIIYQNRRKNFWLTYLSLAIGLLLYTLYHIIYNSKIEFFGTDNYIVIIGFCLFSIVLCTTMLKIKVKKPSIENLKKKPIKELIKIREEAIQNEKIFIERTAYTLANHFALISLITIVFIIPLIIKLIENNFNLTNVIRTYSEYKPSNLFTMLALLAFVVGDFISSFITPNQLKKRKDETIIKIKNSFLINILLSNLNPGMKDEKH